MKLTNQLSVFSILLGVINLGCVYMLTTSKLTNAVCESKNKSWVTIDRCRLRAVRRNLTTLTIEITVLYPAHNIHLNVQVLTKANGYKPWIINYEVDACAFMRKNNHPFVKRLWNSFKKFSTVNHTCPYKGKQMLKDFYLDPVIFEVPLPQGDYLMLLTWKFDKKTQFVTNVYFSILEVPLRAVERKQHTLTVLSGV